MRSAWRVFGFFFLLSGTYIYCIASRMNSSVQIFPLSPAFVLIVFVDRLLFPYLQVQLRSPAELYCPEMRTDMLAVVRLT